MLCLLRFMIIRTDLLRTHQLSLIPERQEKKKSGKSLFLCLSHKSRLTLTRMSVPFTLIVQLVSDGVILSFGKDQDGGKFQHRPVCHVNLFDRCEW